MRSGEIKSFPFNTYTPLLEMKHTGALFAPTQECKSHMSALFAIHTGLFTC
jgi:hypothetical protein